MTIKRAIAALLFLPALVAAAEALSFQAHNRNNGSIVSDGERREYLLYVPPSYERSKAVPLVISLHGAAGWPKQQMELSGWNEVADREHFIVVYPSAFYGPGPRVWRVGEGPGLMKDARFIAELIEKLEASYNIDRSRIYVNGFSNGGGMSFALSCAMPNRIAAVGLVGAALTLPFTWCADHHAVPLIVFHGTDDPEVPYRGGWSWVSPAPFPPVERFAAQWARRNGCAGPAVDAAPAENVVRREYTHCANASSVVLFSVRGGGHTWPGGGELPEYFVGPNTTSISATREMWTFFRAHPLAR